MKKLLLSVATAVMALFMVSCGAKTNELSISDFGSKAKDFVGQEVCVKGVANHICSHSGRKLFLVSPDGGDAMVTVLEGKGRFTVAEDVFFLEVGETLIMPKDIPHAVYGEERFKMQLVVSY